MGRASQLVYLLAFGEDCKRQFELLLPGLLRCQDLDIALITDEPLQYDGVQVYQVATPKDVSHCYSARTGFREVIDIEPYERTWYLDCDFILFDDLFKRHRASQAIIVHKEPGITLASEFFNRDMSAWERTYHHRAIALNAGLYGVPKRYYDFFTFLDLGVQAARLRDPGMHIYEQMVLNSAYIRWNGNPWAFDLVKDIGYPAKGIPGKWAALHFACYRGPEKAGLMQAYLK